ncbi:MAG: hypothetical protein JSR58_06220 [Verrucomicrobia bacterium]|nr:hypothetical protein [Verrucomicrobiota bacterium]
MAKTKEFLMHYGKMGFIAFCSLLTVSVYGFPKKNLAPQPAPPPPPPVTDVSEKNILGGIQGKSASASVDKGWTLSATALLWQAKVDGLEYAQKVQLTADPITNAIAAKAELKELTFEWNPGGKVALGYIFPQRQQWDISLEWTYLFAKAHGSAHVDDPTLMRQQLKPSWIPLLMGSVASNAHAAWSMHYNVGDLTLGRNLFLGKYLAMKPFVGVRGAWIEQNYKVHYRGAQFANNAPVFHDNEFNAKQDLKAGGIRLGSDLQWFLSSHWSILGNISASLLYGQFHLKETVSGEVGVANVVIPETIRLKDHDSRLNPNLEGKLGLKCQAPFHHGRYRVSLAAFYDFSYWFNQNRQLNETVVVDPSSGNAPSTMNRSNGNLQLQGVSVELALAF